jgi:hypothetical protein
MNVSVCPRILSVVTMIGFFHSGFKFHCTFLLLLNNMEYVIWLGIRANAAQEVNQKPQSQDLILIVCLQLITTPSAIS